MSRMSQLHPKPFTFNTKHLRQPNKHEHTIKQEDRGTLMKDENDDAMLQSILQGFQLKHPPHLKIKCCDVLVVGGGIAGLQCIDTLTRECASIASLLGRRLKIVHLEGQSRIGGRIESVKVTRDGEKEPITVEKGAAFIHSCDEHGGNLAFNLAVRYNLCRRWKADFKDDWFYHGARLPHSMIHTIRESFEKLETEILDHVNNEIKPKMATERMKRQSIFADIIRQDDKMVQKTYPSATPLHNCPVRIEQHDGGGDDMESEALIDDDDDIMASPPMGGLYPREEAVSQPPDDIMDSPEIVISRQFSAAVLNLEALTKNRSTDTGSSADAPIEIDDIGASPSSDESLMNESNVNGSDISDNDSDSSLRTETNSADSSNSSKSESESDQTSDSTSSESTERKQMTATQHKLPRSLQPKQQFIQQQMKFLSQNSMKFVSDVYGVNSCNDAEDSPLSSRSAPLFKQLARVIDIEPKTEADELSNYVRPHSSVKSRHIPREEDSLNDANDADTSDVNLSDEDENEFSSPNHREAKRRRLSRSTEQHHRREISAPLDEPDENELPPSTERTKRFDRLLRPDNVTDQSHAFIPELDVSFEELYQQYAEKYIEECCRINMIDKCGNRDKEFINNAVQRAFDSLKTSNWGYVASTAQHSAYDMGCSWAFTGGERYLPFGFAQIVDILQFRIARRMAHLDAAFDYELLMNHVVKLIDQPMNPNTLQLAPFALVHCPQQNLMIVARYVIATSSIGIMQDSIKEEEQLRRSYAHLLQDSDPIIKCEGAKMESHDQVDLKPASPASILFQPTLSSSKKDIFLSHGMGLENKIIMIFPRGARFWPNDIHLLRTHLHPTWRFYNIDGITQEDVCILIAHRPPNAERQSHPDSQTTSPSVSAPVIPLSAQDIEITSDEEIIIEVMKVLFDMFQPNGTEQLRRAIEQIQIEQKQLPRDAELRHQRRKEIKKVMELEHIQPADKYREVTGDEIRQRQASDEINLENTSTSEDEFADSNNPLGKHHRQLYAKQLRQAKKNCDKQFCAIDTTWQSNPVIPPIHFIVTRWRSNPFARGAYSYIPVGANVTLSYRLTEWEPASYHSKSAPHSPSSSSTFPLSPSLVLPPSSDNGTETSGSVGVLLFAGEGLAKLDQQQVHGAMESGQTSAEKVISRMRENILKEKKKNNEQNGLSIKLK